MVKKMITTTQAKDLYSKAVYYNNEIAYLDNRMKREVKSAKDLIYKSHILVDYISELKGNKKSQQILNDAKELAAQVVRQGCAKFNYKLF